MANTKILIVDDEKEILDSLSSILKRANYQVFSTTKGKEAVDLAKEIIPDAIILDIMMPDMSGDEVAAALSECPSTAKIPIIFLTAILTKEEEMVRGNFGRQFVIAKPTTGEKILEMVKNILAVNPIG